MTSSIGHWPHVVFLPIWWADLLDWRCFWPPSEFTACWVFLSAQKRAETVSVLARGRGGGAICESSLTRGGGLLAWGVVAGLAFFCPSCAGLAVLSLWWCP